MHVPKGAFMAKILLVDDDLAFSALLREAMADACDRADLRLLAPSPPLCTDNGAMIAAAGWNRLIKGERSATDLAADPGLALQGWSTR